MRTFIFDVYDAGNRTLFQIEVIAQNQHEAEGKAMHMAEHKNGGKACEVRLVGERR